MCCLGPARVMKSGCKDIPKRDGRRVHGLVQLLTKSLGAWNVGDGRKTA
jgi:hypothetical protein